MHAIEASINFNLHLNIFQIFRTVEIFHVTNGKVEPVVGSKIFKIIVIRQCILIKVKEKVKKKVKFIVNGITVSEIR